ncbi:MAG: hypothetical protein MRZ54_05335 [Clostridiales bacterium]|nr:hypothetical protein [Clostridiales bacterium]
MAAWVLRARLAVAVRALAWAALVLRVLALALLVRGWVAAWVLRARLAVAVRALALALLVLAWVALVLRGRLAVLA